MISDEFSSISCFRSIDTFRGFSNFEIVKFWYYFVIIDSPKSSSLSKNKKKENYKNSFLERYELIGERALDLTSPFDEMTILNESIDYINATLESTFGLQGVQVKFPMIL